MQSPQNSESQNDDSEGGDRIVPSHIAFIMDGNGRWAKRRGKLRVFGHETGAESLRRITRHCRSIGVREVTFYALSTENYTRRPPREVSFLLKLLKKFLIQERSELTENEIRFRTVGDIEGLPAAIQKEIAITTEMTSHYTEMTMRLALNYGSRQEIVEAAKRLAREVASGRMTEEQLDAVDPEIFSSFLLEPEMADPDLVIRTAGEFRLSNFLLWQSSYSEWWITDVLWPEFDIPDLEQALADFGSRERRFGAVTAGDALRERS